MANRQSFGRRPGTSPGATFSAPARTSPPARTPQRDLAPAAADAAWTVDDPELEAWMRARQRHIPWRQLSLMASLCFGIGSLVLPGSVNDAVQWPLYGLAAASFYAGIRRRRAV